MITQKEIENIVRNNDRSCGCCGPTDIVKTAEEIMALISAQSEDIPLCSFDD